MRKIIVPVDFTDYSENAIKTAVFLANKINAEIILLHMITSSASLISSSKKNNNENQLFHFQLVKNKIKELLDPYSSSGQKISLDVKSPISFKEIGKIAERKGADLILMASHGATGLKELFIGSNAEKVVRNSKIPVLIIKDTPIIKDFKKAIFACDFSSDFIDSYKKAKKILQILDCNLELLYVNTAGEEFKTTAQKKERVINFLIEADGDLKNFKNVVYVSEYTIESGIMEYANTEHKDLIVMPTRGKKGLDHLLLGSIAEDIVNHSSLPVLTISC